MRSANVNYDTTVGKLYIDYKPINFDLLILRQINKKGRREGGKE